MPLSGKRDKSVPERIARNCNKIKRKVSEQVPPFFGFFFFLPFFFFFFFSLLLSLTLFLALSPPRWRGVAWQESSILTLLLEDRWRKGLVIKDRVRHYWHRLLSPPTGQIIFCLIDSCCCWRSIWPKLALRNSLAKRAGWREEQSLLFSETPGVEVEAWDKLAALCLRELQVFRRQHSVTLPAMGRLLRTQKLRFCVCRESRAAEWFSVYRG